MLDASCASGLRHADSMMATTTISLTTEAYHTLSKLKKKGQSFSEVIVEHLRFRPETCGELLAELERDIEGMPITTVGRLQTLGAARGRRSNRRGPQH